MSRFPPPFASTVLLAPLANPPDTSPDAYASSSDSSRKRPEFENDDQDGGGSSDGESEQGRAGDPSENGAGPSTATKPKATRASAACTGCRKIKSKCVGGDPCERCRATGAECIFLKSNRGRRPGKRIKMDPKPMVPPDSSLHAAFQSLSQADMVASGGGANMTMPPPLPRREDAKLHSLPDNSLNPLGLLAEASLSRKPPNFDTDFIGTPSGEAGGQDPSDPENVASARGIADDKYFKPGPMNILPIRRQVFVEQVPSELLSANIISTEEVKDLFELYYTHLHRHYPVLDPALHTPETTLARSPFLFTTICTVASRFYRKGSPGLYKRCLSVTKRAAFAFMARGWKSPEVAQGFMILSKWNQPAERFEEEITYQLVGIGIRLAMDLGLHRKTPALSSEGISEEAKREFDVEVHNRERLWLLLFVSDRSLSIQMGKPHFIDREGPLIETAKHWWKQPGSQPLDRNLAGMVELHRIVLRMVQVLYSEDDGPTGLKKSLDYTIMIEMFSGLLDQWSETWQSPGDDTFPTELGTPGFHSPDFYLAYYRLLLYSFGVQYSLQSSDHSLDLPSYVYRCFESASTVLEITRGWHSLGWLTYGIDPKLSSPAFNHIIPSQKVVTLAAQGADMLATCAFDSTHTPALYATFIRALLKNRMDASTTRPSSPEPHQSQPHAAAPPADPGPFLWDTLAASAPTHDALDGAAIDVLTSNQDFWNNMLFPGFGGSQVSLSGGNGMVAANDPADPTAYAFLLSRPSSPHQEETWTF
ncbi:hypothetical protein MNV49_007045 [Pseudohyphozyma bogoriensis]|nr:hypothetical protein MNV49_007045 [Pseudohyphozyma bogoriensis]